MFGLQVGDLIGSLVAKEVLQLDIMAKLILAAGNEEAPEGEDAQLIDAGAGLPVIAAALKQFEAASNPETALKAWGQHSLQIESFIASVSTPHLPLSTLSWLEC